MTNGPVFSDSYGTLLVGTPAACEEAPVPEELLQQVWHEQQLGEDLASEQGHRIEVLSPGWWNRQAGPDFKGAQLRFNGELVTGDVEVHFDAAEWRRHGHHQDARYNDVILHVVMRGDEDAAVTLSGRRIAALLMPRFASAPVEEMLAAQSYGCGYALRGRCTGLLDEAGPGHLLRFLDMAGEWRILRKAQQMRERIEYVGGDQAVYEQVFYASGFSAYREQFLALAQALPYERARQLAQQNPLLLECALLHLARLLPEEVEAPPPHLARLQELRVESLPGLRPLTLAWPRNGVRPANYPERRVGGLARLVARTAGPGLAAALDAIWREDMRPPARRAAFEALFPRAMGFWGSHCTWLGKSMRRPQAPLGAGRVRAIIGNIFIPAALALARLHRDRTREERIFAFFDALPREPENHVVRRMAERVLPREAPPRLNFRMQQGLLQMHQDWCENNPACANCRLLAYFEAQTQAAAQRSSKALDSVPRGTSSASS